MIKLRWQYHRWRIKRIENRLRFHREAVKKIIFTGGSFHFKEGQIDGTELDDSEPSIHVIPSYYDYDADGEASGDVNKNYKEVR